LQVELGTVIGYDHLGSARPSIKVVSSRVIRSTRHRCVGNPAKALPGHLIDDVEDTKAVAASELVVDEITGD
jgi:hypothetical protein